MTDTRDKLLEAKYFLERMKETESDRDPFRYNLSAFLSAARSVTLFMQKEYNEIPGFGDYYAEKQCEMQQDKTMKFLYDLRVVTIHLHPVRPDAHIDMSFGDHFGLSDRATFVLTRPDGSTEKRGPSSTPPPPSPEEFESKTEYKWYFHEMPDRDVITICEEHIAKLDGLVTECESKFPVPHSDTGEKY